MPRQIKGRYGSRASGSSKRPTRMRYGWWGPWGWIPGPTPRQAARYTARKAGDLSDYIASTIAAAKLGLRVGGLSGFRGHRNDLLKMKAAIRDDYEAAVREAEAKYYAKQQAVLDTTRAEEDLRQYSKLVDTGRMARKNVEHSPAVAAAKEDIMAVNELLANSMAPHARRPTPASRRIPVHPYDPYITVEDEDGIPRAFALTNLEATE